MKIGRGESDPEGLEDAKFKLASVASDILGHSGRAMLDAMIKGQTDVEVLAEMHAAE